MQPDSKSDRKRLVVVGAGAAGYFCAVHAAALAPGLEVLVLEKSGKSLSKVKVSGGGRCNVTHQAEHWQELLPAYPRGTQFLKRSLSAFSQEDTCRWFESRGVKLKTEPDGRMFPQSNSSQSIIDCLQQEARRLGIVVRYGAAVCGLAVETPGGFRVLPDQGTELQADYVCIACGGMANPRQGAWLESLGIRMVAGVPSLFTFQLPGNPIVELQGVSVPEVRLQLPGFRHAETGPLLITHWGFSGPAVLKLSAWAARYLAECRYRHEILVNWLPGSKEEDLRAYLMYFRQQYASARIAQRCDLELPLRLWQFMLQQCAIPADLRWADLNSKALNMLIRQLQQSRFLMQGKTTFKEEFVTCGGVDLSQIDAHTMSCKAVPELFFAGEVLDVDGITGGYNFQHAWSSGAIAGKAIAERAFPRA